MGIKEIVQGDVLLRKWFSKNIFLFLLIAILWIVYIANRYGIETKVRQIENTNKEIKELEMKRTSIKTQYQKSSMMMEVAAFAGYELLMKAYKTAVAEKYRFFTYGDAMLIL